MDERPPPPPAADAAPRPQPQLHGEERADARTSDSSPLLAPAVLVALFIGLPGSGKTTLLRAVEALLLALLESAAAVASVVFDEEGALEAGAFSPEQWHASRAASLARIEHLLSSAAGLRVLLVEDNCWLRSMRKAVLASLRHSARRADIAASPPKLLTLFVDVDVDTAVARDAARQRPVGEATVRRMAAAFERPLHGALMALEPRWERRHTHLPPLGPNASAGDVASLLLAAAAPGARPDLVVELPEQLLAGVASSGAAGPGGPLSLEARAGQARQSADLLLREIVADILAPQLGPQPPPARGRRLATAKRAVLEELRRGLCAAASRLESTSGADEGGVDADFASLLRDTSDRVVLARLLEAQERVCAGERSS